MTPASRCLLLLASLALALPVFASREEADVLTEDEVQALVFELADEYITSLSETVYLNRDEADARTRWLTQSFLRNGTGSAISIATGPDPDLALLDLLVLSSLQRSSFTRNWIPAGIEPGIGRTVGEALRRIEELLWYQAGEVVGEEHLVELKHLIDEWLAKHPDRLVVAYVRFGDFSDAHHASDSTRDRARGLLSRVKEASRSVDEARLLGERAVWMANRYPFLVGQQLELTLYRMVDQPDIQRYMDSLAVIGQAEQVIGRELARLSQRVEDQQEELFHSIAEERKVVIRTVFWRVLILVGVAVAGSALVRMLPRRS